MCVWQMQTGLSVRTSNDRLALRSLCVSLPAIQCLPAKANEKLAMGPIQPLWLVPTQRSHGM
eukprot:4881383-Amphidinium_carterae.1